MSLPRLYLTITNLISVGVLITWNTRTEVLAYKFAKIKQEICYTTQIKQLNILLGLKELSNGLIQSHLCTRYLHTFIPLLSALLKQCVKKVRVVSFSGPHFPTFRLNTEIYFANVHIKGQCGKMLFKKTPNMGTFYAVQYADSAQKNKFLH